jgi:CheY-like chemotaxis protein
MPVMNGIEMTSKLRQLEKASSDPSPIPIIGISGNVLAEDVEAARRAGITDYLGKPFKFSELDSMMLKYLINRQRTEFFNSVSKVKEASQVAGTQAK